MRPCYFCGEPLESANPGVVKCHKACAEKLRRIKQEAEEKRARRLAGFLCKHCGEVLPTPCGAKQYHKKCSYLVRIESKRVANMTLEQAERKRVSGRNRYANMTSEQREKHCARGSDYRDQQQQTKEYFEILGLIEALPDLINETI